MSQAYLDTLARMEQDIAAVDAVAFYASAAISLRRIADALQAPGRDLLAAMVMHGLIAGRPTPWEEGADLDVLTAAAYNGADALIRAREEK